jgi:hypothetical protein
MPDAERVRQRLELSDGELRCPMKGQIAVARCRQLQEETAAEQRPCLCNVGRAAMGIELVTIAEAPTDPIAATVVKHLPKAGGSHGARPQKERPPMAAVAGPSVANGKHKPPLREHSEAPATHRGPASPATPAPSHSNAVGFKKWLARKREKDAAETAPLPKKLRERRSVERAVERLVEEGEVRPEAAEVLVEHATKPKENIVADKDGATARVLAAMARTPDAEWTLAEVFEVKKGSRAAVSPMLLRLEKQGKVERAGDGKWKFVSGATSPAPSKKPRRTAPPPTRKERPMREENPAEGSELLIVARKLRWLISGLADNLVQLDEVYTYAKSDDVDRVLG